MNILVLLKIVAENKVGGKVDVTFDWNVMADKHFDDVWFQIMSIIFLSVFVVVESYMYVRILKSFRTDYKRLKKIYFDVNCPLWKINSDNNKDNENE